MATTEKVKVVITGENKTKRAFKETGAGFSKLSKLSGALALGVGAGLVGAFSKLGGALKNSVSLFNEQIRVETQLDAVLKSTKNAAGLTAEELKKMASGLQKVTTFGDEAVIGAENLLLTFTNIGRDVFPDALETVLDMSTALGQDLKSSAVQLGKAINDPILGISALSSVGVSFTEVQKDMIKEMVEAGDTMGAQKLILEELATEFGGSASAQAATFAGKIQQLKNTFGDLQERVGAFLAETLTPYVDKVAAWVESDQSRQLVEDLKDGFFVLKSVLGPIVKVTLKLLLVALKDVGKAITELKDFMVPLVQGFKDLRTQLDPIISKLNTVIELVRKAIDAFKRLKDVGGGAGGPSIGGGSITGAALKPLLPFGNLIPPKLSFANGGVVPGPLGQAVQATVHGGERVIPAGGGGGAGLTINISGNTFLDDNGAEELGDRIVNVLKRNLRI